MDVVLRNWVGSVMTPDTQRVAEIAGKLTDGQRDGLLDAFPASLNRLAVAFCTGSQASLCALGLAEGEFWPYLTPLGLAVRQYLKDNSNE